MTSSASPATQKKPKKPSQTAASTPVTGGARGKQPPLRRAVVIAGRLEGKATEEIAKDAGCVPRTVYRELAKPETKSLISELVQEHKAQICRGLGGLVGRAVRVIESEDTQHEEAMRAGDRLLTMVQAHDREVGRLAEMQLGGDMDGMMLEELMLVRRVLMRRRKPEEQGQIVEGTAE